MPHVARSVPAGLVAGAVVLLAACSGPAPAEAPSPPVAGAPTTSAPTSPAPEASSAAPGTEPGTPAPSGAPPSAEPPPAQGEPSVVPSVPVETAPPKKLDQSTRTAGAVVSLVSVRATRIKATTPGDRSGPGLLVRLQLENATARTLDTSFTQVGLTDEAGNPATLLVGPPTKALDASVRAGRSVRGTYAFSTDGAPSGPVTVSVYVTSGQPVVTFRGRPS